MTPSVHRARSNDLIDTVVVLPDGIRAKVIGVRDEYDDGCTLVYLEGPYRGSLTERDTYAVRRYQRLDWSVTTEVDGWWIPAIPLNRSTRHWPWLQRIVDWLGKAHR